MLPARPASWQGFEEVARRRLAATRTVRRSTAAPVACHRVWAARRKLRVLRLRCRRRRVGADMLHPAFACPGLPTPAGEGGSRIGDGPRGLGGTDLDDNSSQAGPGSGGWGSSWWPALATEGGNASFFGHAGWTSNTWHCRQFESSLTANSLASVALSYGSGAQTGPGHLARIPSPSQVGSREGRRGDGPHR